MRSCVRCSTTSYNGVALGNIERMLGIDADYDDPWRTGPFRQPCKGEMGVRRLVTLAREDGLEAVSFP